MALVVSAFLFQYVGVAIALWWVAGLIALEGFGFWAKSRVLAGRAGAPGAFLLSAFMTSLWWVLHAVLLWRTGALVAEIATLMDIFTITLYAAIGSHRKVTLMLAVMVPLLVTLCALLIPTLWRLAPPPMAFFGTLATFGAAATIIANGLQLNASDRRLMAANRVKDAFLANMSHEIRTPLNGVIAVAGALKAGPLDARQREMVELIGNSGEVLERLLSDILDLSKLSAGEVTLVEHPFDLRETIEASAYLQRTRADDKGIGFDVVYGPDARGEFVGDAVRVRQIVANLTSNAVKFTDQGAVTVSVGVAVAEAQAASTIMTIHVTDTGIGLDAANEKRLFQRFFQTANSVDRHLGGTGLGLAICKSLCEAMGGSIQVKSRLGQGATFTVSLPMRRTISLNDLDKRRMAASPPSIASFSDRDGPLKVLLAEDNLINQRVFRLILEAFNVDLIMVENGQEALEAFGRDRFDLVLVDMRMPKMDGLAAARAMRAIEQAEGRTRTPMVMLSANAMREHVDAAQAAGCDLHVAKPVSPERLAELLAWASSA